MGVCRKRFCLYAITLIGSFLLIFSYFLDTTEIIFDDDAQPDPSCGYLIRGHGLSDGLGNLMFIYASFYGTVKKQRKAKKAPFVRITDIPSPYGNLPLREIFANLSIPEKVLPDSWFSSRKFIHRDEQKCCAYDGTGLERLKCDGTNVMVLGCRESFRYFDQALEEIKKEFTFKKSIQEKCADLVDDSLAKKSLKRETCVSVAVHLRRGDFASEKLTKNGFLPAQFDYLQKAIRYHEKAHFENKTKIIDCLVFLIFGTDHEWNLNASRRVELLRPEKTHLILIDPEKSTPAIDMCAMRLCDHMIVTVGTFGWWAGFYIRGIVTYQQEFARLNSPVSYAYDPDGYFLPHWIAL